MSHKRPLVLPELVCYKICVMSSITKKCGAKRLKIVEREARLHERAKRACYLIIHLMVHFFFTRVYFRVSGVDRYSRLMQYLFNKRYLRYYITSNQELPDGTIVFHIYVSFLRSISVCVSRLDVDRYVKCGKDPNYFIMIYNSHSIVEEVGDCPYDKYQFITN